jgi:hypothetical protein
MEELLMSELIEELEDVMDEEDVIEDEELLDDQLLQDQPVCGLPALLKACMQAARSLPQTPLQASDGVTFMAFVRSMRGDILAFLMALRISFAFRLLIEEEELEEAFFMTFITAFVCFVGTSLGWRAKAGAEARSSEAAAATEATFVSIVKIGKK